MYTELSINIFAGLMMIMATFLLHAFGLDRLMGILSPFIRRARLKTNDESHIWTVASLMVTATGIIFGAVPDNQWR